MNIISQKKVSANKVLPILIVGAVIITAWSACTTRGSQKANAAPSGTAVPGVPVDALILKPEYLDEGMDVSGTLQANQEVNIMSELSRKIVSIHFAEGRYIKKGQLLFKLDDADLRAQLEQLRQQEKLARLNEVRLKDLINNQAVMQQDYDQSFTNLKVLEAQIRQVQVSIDKTYIRAPFSGKIGIVNVHPGALVSPGTSLATLEDASQIKLDFAVPEKYTHNLTTGDVLKFSVESNDNVYTARIIAKESKLDNATRNLVIRALGSNPNSELLPGQSARVKLKLENSSDAIMIPNQTLIPSSQGYSVYISKGNKATLVPVELGERNALSVHIQKGLAQGDTLITSNMLRLNPGSPLNIVSIN